MPAKKNKIPSKIKVGALTYDIVFKEYTHGDNTGWIELEKGEIQIKKGLHPTVEKIAVMHEIVHAILYSWGKSENHDEEFVDRMAFSLVQLLQDNPELGKM